MRIASGITTMVVESGFVTRGFSRGMNLKLADEADGCKVDDYDGGSSGEARFCQGGSRYVGVKGPPNSERMSG